MPQKCTNKYTTEEQLIIECDQKLDSISDWPMGQCGSRTTADPRVFGPEAWITFHRFAQNYPKDPTDQTIQACIDFTKSIPYMLPCPHCGYDFKQFILANEENEKSNPYAPACSSCKEYNMPCQGIVTACQNQQNLVNFFLRAHHNVDKLTKPCKPLYSPQQAAEAYTNQQNFCATGIVYGTEEICKSKGDTGCVS
jgi:hypothetical protein